jgi:hypothetical protein
LKVDIVILHHSPGAKHGLALLSRPNFVRFVWKKSLSLVCSNDNFDSIRTT